MFHTFQINKLTKETIDSECKHDDIVLSAARLGIILLWPDENITTIFCLVLDYEKQQAINLFLGLFRPRPDQPSIWELPTDFYLHNPYTPHDPASTGTRLVATVTGSKSSVSSNQLA